MGNTQTQTFNNNLFTQKPACTHSLIIYVPSTQGLKGAISQEEHNKRTKHIANYMSDLFGGATVTNASGKYKANNGERVSEPVNQVATACTWEQLQGAKGEQVSNLIASVKNTWGQESIAVEVVNNSNMYFV